MDYKEQFSKRADSYFSAMSAYPDAMNEEFQTAVDSLKLEGGERIVNIPGGCVNLERFLDSTIQYLSFEIDERFAAKVNQPVCTLWEVPCTNTSVDRVITVAALHHSSQEERRKFYQEVKRILKPNGLFVIADVEKGSSQDKWLNGFVNQYNSVGHKGLFWSEDDIGLLQEEGFSVEMVTKSYAWRFADREAMLAFSKDLFYLDKANLEEIQEGLTRVLGASEKTIPWRLVYFICRLCP
jgi:SAM-dependent methyltransferase